MDRPINDFLYGVNTSDILLSKPWNPATGYPTQFSEGFVYISEGEGSVGGETYFVGDSIIYKDGAWHRFGTSGAAELNWEELSVSANPTSDKNYLVDTSGGSLTVTLPPSPTEGMTFRLVPIKPSYHEFPLFIDVDGGHLVNGSAVGSLTIDTVGQGVLLHYVNVTTGWALIEYGDTAIINTIDANGLTGVLTESSNHTITANYNFDGDVDLTDANVIGFSGFDPAADQTITGAYTHDGNVDFNGDVDFADANVIGLQTSAGIDDWTPSVGDVPVYPDVQGSAGGTMTVGADSVTYESTAISGPIGQGGYFTHYKHEGVTLDETETLMYFSIDPAQHGDYGYYGFTDDNANWFMFGGGIIGVLRESPTSIRVHVAIGDVDGTPDDGSGTVYATPLLSTDVLAIGAIITNTDVTANLYLNGNSTPISTVTVPYVNATRADAEAINRPFITGYGTDTLTAPVTVYTNPSNPVAGKAIASASGVLPSSYPSVTENSAFLVTGLNGGSKLGNVGVVNNGDVVYFDDSGIPTTYAPSKESISNNTNVFNEKMYISGDNLMIGQDFLGYGVQNYQDVLTTIGRKVVHDVSDGDLLAEVGTTYYLTGSMPNTPIEITMVGGSSGGLETTIVDLTSASSNTNQVVANINSDKTAWDGSSVVPVFSVKGRVINSGVIELRKGQRVLICTGGASYSAASGSGFSGTHYNVSYDDYAGEWTNINFGTTFTYGGTDNIRVELTSGENYSLINSITGTDEDIYLPDVNEQSKPIELIVSGTDATATVTLNGTFHLDVNSASVSSHTFGDHVHVRIYPTNDGGTYKWALIETPLGNGASGSNLVAMNSGNNTAEFGKTYYPGLNVAGGVTTASLALPSSATQGTDEPITVIGNDSGTITLLCNGALPNLMLPDGSSVVTYTLSANETVWITPYTHIGGVLFKLNSSLDSNLPLSDTALASYTADGSISLTATGTEDITMTSGDEFIINAGTSEFSSGFTVNANNFGGFADFNLYDYFHVDLSNGSSNELRLNAGVGDVVLRTNGDPQSFSGDIILDAQHANGSVLLTTQTADMNGSSPSDLAVATKKYVDFSANRPLVRMTTDPYTIDENTQGSNYIVDSPNTGTITVNLDNNKNPATNAAFQNGEQIHILNGSNNEILLVSLFGAVITNSSAAASNQSGTNLILTYEEQTVGDDFWHVQTVDAFDPNMNQFITATWDFNNSIVTTKDSNVIDWNFEEVIGNNEQTLYADFGKKYIIANYKSRTSFGEVWIPNAQGIIEFWMQGTLPTRINFTEQSNDIYVNSLGHTRTDTVIVPPSCRVIVEQKSGYKSVDVITSGRSHNSIRTVGDELDNNYQEQLQWCTALHIQNRSTTGIAKLDLQRMIDDGGVTNDFNDWFQRPYMEIAHTGKGAQLQINSGVYDSFEFIENGVTSQSIIMDNDSVVRLQLGATASNDPKIHVMRLTSTASSFDNTSLASYTADGDINMNAESSSELNLGGSEVNIEPTTSGTFSAQGNNVTVNGNGITLTTQITDEASLSIQTSAMNSDAPTDLAIATKKYVDDNAGVDGTASLTVDTTLQLGGAVTGYPVDIARTSNFGTRAIGFDGTTSFFGESILASAMTANDRAETSLGTSDLANSHESLVLAYIGKDASGNIYADTRLQAYTPASSIANVTAYSNANGDVYISSSRQTADMVGGDSDAYLATKKYVDDTTNTATDFSVLKTGTLAVPPTGMAVGEKWLDTTDSAVHPVLRISTTTT